MVSTGIACESSRVNVLAPDGSPSLLVMDFREPFALDPPPAGWRHRKFLTRAPAHFSFATVEGVPALRIETDDSASMLFRHVDVPLREYPRLSWNWFVEQPIESDTDELTAEGDDHPARLFLVFENEDGEGRAMEIIWGNRVLRAGDYKYINEFPHYTANGGSENVGRWHRESVDLTRIYREIWDDPTDVRLVDVAIFCDSDETDSRSVAYFADVRLDRADGARVPNTR